MVLSPNEKGGPLRDRPRCTITGGDAGPSTSAARVASLTFGVLRRPLPTAAAAEKGEVINGAGRVDRENLAPHDRHAVRPQWQRRSLRRSLRGRDRRFHGREHAQVPRQVGVDSAVRQRGIAYRAALLRGRRSCRGGRRRGRRRGRGRGRLRRCRRCGCPFRQAQCYAGCHPCTSGSSATSACRRHRCRRRRYRRGTPSTSAPAARRRASCPHSSAGAARPLRPHRAAMPRLVSVNRASRATAFLATFSPTTSSRVFACGCPLRS